MLKNSNNPYTRRILRSAEAAKYLGVSQWKLREMVRKLELPYLQYNDGPWLFDVRDLEAYIERNKRFANPL